MKKWFLLLVLSALVLVGCAASKSGGATAQTQSPQGGDGSIPVVRKANSDNVIAEGVVAPARSSYLAFTIPGDVVEILVEARAEPDREQESDEAAEQRDLEARPREERSPRRLLLVHELELRDLGHAGG